MAINVAAGSGGGGGGGGGTSGDPAGTATALMNTHIGATDPHASRSTQPIRTQAGNFTLAATDKGQLIKCTDSGATQTCTVPANIFAAGDIVYVRAYGALGGIGVTFVAGASMVVNSPKLVLGTQFATVAVHFDGPTECTLSPQLS